MSKLSRTARDVKVAAELAYGRDKGQRMFYKTLREAESLVRREAELRRATWDGNIKYVCV